MRTIALMYAIYIGFEVIADDAEEVKNPNKNIPTAILISLGLITVLYALTIVVTLGTVPLAVHCWFPNCFKFHDQQVPSGLWGFIDRFCRYGGLIDLDQFLHAQRHP